AKVVSKCLAKRPSDRWHSAGDVAAALRQVKKPRTRSASPSPSPVSPKRGEREGGKRDEREGRRREEPRRVWPLALALLLVAAVSAALVARFIVSPRNTAITPVATARRSIAVLGFRN